MERDARRPASPASPTQRYTQHDILEDRNAGNEEDEGGRTERRRGTLSVVHVGTKVIMHGSSDRGSSRTQGSVKIISFPTFSLTHA